MLCRQLRRDLPRTAARPVARRRAALRPPLPRRPARSRLSGGARRCGRSSGPTARGSSAGSAALLGVRRVRAGDPRLAPRRDQRLGRRARGARRRPRRHRDPGPRRRPRPGAGPDRRPAALLGRQRGRAAARGQAARSDPADLSALLRRGRLGAVAGLDPRAAAAAGADPGRASRGASPTSWPTWPGATPPARRGRRGSSKGFGRASTAPGAGAAGRSAPGPASAAAAATG